MYKPFHFLFFFGHLHSKNPKWGERLQNWEKWCRQLKNLKEEMATDFSTPAWRISRTEEPGGVTAHGVTKSRTRACTHAWTLQCKARKHGRKVGLTSEPLYLLSPLPTTPFPRSSHGLNPFCQLKQPFFREAFPVKFHGNYIIQNKVIWGFFCLINVSLFPTLFSQQIGGIC